MSPHQLASAWLLGLALSTPLPDCLADTPAPRPNIILIVTDDQGYNDVGFNGSKEILTPNIDRIANEGVRFSQGYVTGAVCGPSRAGFLTGRYQSRFGFEWNPPLDPNDRAAGLPLQEAMIPEYLKPAGYRTMVVGKWHMGTHPDLRPARRGFDEFYGFLSGGHNYLPEDIRLDDISQSRKVGDWYLTRLRHNEGYHDLKQYLTDELSDRAVDFVRRNRAGPFFLYLAFNAPHVPLQATPKYLSRYPHIEDEDRRTYAAMISAVDDGVGRLLHELDELGIADDTLIFFLSDNGGKLPKRPGEKHVADNAPLRGGKGELYEGGVRVPFAIRWPNQVRAGMEYDSAVSSLDILATIVSQLGLPTLPDRPLDGTDLIPYLKGDKTGEPHAALFWRRLEAGDVSVVQGDQKYISTRAGSGMYDLKDDVGEARNVLGQHPERAAELRAMHETWKAGMATEGAFGTRTSWPGNGRKRDAED